MIIEAWVSLSKIGMSSIRKFSWKEAYSYIYIVIVDGEVADISHVLSCEENSACCRKQLHIILNLYIFCPYQRRDWGGALYRY